MHRKIFNHVVVVLLLSFLTSCAYRNQKPNIVFIVVDDLGWTDTGFNGSSYYETPYMDQLAKEGANFTQAYAACAVCSPTRASIITGKYPARLQLTTHIPSMAKGWNMGIPTGNAEFTLNHPASPKQSGIPNRNYLPLEETTIAEMLKKAGYYTGYIGKWHLGHDAYHPTYQGFDWQAGVTNWGQPMSYYAPYQRLVRGITHRIESLQKGLQEGEYLTDRLGREAVNFIQENRQKNFFLHLAFYAVHTPIQPPKEKIPHFDEKSKAENHQNSSYAAMVNKVDENIGRILDTLKELGMERNTMVVLYSDNGGLLRVTSNKPLRKGKGYAYEGGIRVPLVIKWPGKIKKGQTLSVPVTSVDFLPSFCAAVGIKIGQAQQIDGKNILPVLKNRQASLDRSLYWHFPHYRGNDIVPYSIIRDGDWKLIKRYDGKEFELFNLKEDLSEKIDLAGVMPDKVLELNNKLEAWKKNTGAKVPQPVVIKE
ncbi:sulfatase [Fulvivirgaceae bacterium BMA10]|uniref:Sulfatase n=1 Tax=Splendidivirga corallicola TaxID=3051826 RepID=A0ABT8KVU7_9BACT|nr:sulfatase [Fulvivirgaceae bacterium BMA10]